MQAWHVLDYGLQKSEAWPTTRELLLELAPKMEQAGFRDEWIPYLERGKESSKLIDDQVTEIEICVHAGYLYYLQSNFEKADEWLNLGLKLHNLTNASDNLLAKILNRLAFVAHRQQKIQIAQSLIYRVFSLNISNASELANSYYILGAIELGNRNLLDAERNHKKSLELWREHREKRKIAWGLRNLGPVLYERGMVREAVEHFQEAIAILEEIQDSHNLAVAQMNLGIVYTLSDNHQEAINLFLQAESIFVETESRLYLAKVYHNQGMVLRKVAKWKQSEKAYQKSLDLWKQLGDKPSEINTIDGLGMVLMGQGLYKDAIKLFCKALAELAKLKFHTSHDFLQNELTTHLEAARQYQIRHGEFVLHA